MKEQDFGIFLSFQNPEEIAGIKTTDFLRFAKTKVSDEKISSMNFALRVAKEIENLNMKKDMQGRYLNVGFSGGEKKKNEILLDWMKKYKVYEVNSNYISRFDNTRKINSREVYVTNYEK